MKLDNGIVGRSGRVEYFLDDLPARGIKRNNVGGAHDTVNVEPTHPGPKKERQVDVAKRGGGTDSFICIKGR